MDSSVIRVYIKFCGFTLDCDARTNSNSFGNQIECDLANVLTRVCRRTLDNLGGVQTIVGILWAYLVVDIVEVEIVAD